uniref:Thyroliberin n=1 Tax=Oncorhynchus tshawytscha TaxID=74940 RepID=A0A8C8HXC9_ONCTS
PRDGPSSGTFLDSHPVYDSRLSLTYLLPTPWINTFRDSTICIWVSPCVLISAFIIRWLEGLTSQPEWLVKRQHPGKRYQEELEKRQHPGKREEDEDEDYGEVQKRQHPGKREDEFDSFVDLQRRQHPGKRLILEQITENPAFLSELSKRQHPGKRYVMYYSKRQHPGRREVDDESDAGDLKELEKRQHPGKRYLDNTSPDLDANSPCDVLDPGCSKANLLLQLLDNVNKSRAEKRQHPGKRSAPVEDLTEQE